MWKGFYCPYTLVMRCGRYLESNPFGGVEFLSNYPNNGDRVWVVSSVDCYAIEFRVRFPLQFNRNFLRGMSPTSPNKIKKMPSKNVLLINLLTRCLSTSAVLRLVSNKQRYFYMVSTNLEYLENLE